MASWLEQEDVGWKVVGSNLGGKFFITVMPVKSYLTNAIYGPSEHKFDKYVIYHLYKKTSLWQTSKKLMTSFVRVELFVSLSTRQNLWSNCNWTALKLDLQPFPPKKVLIMMTSSWSSATTKLTLCMKNWRLSRRNNKGILCPLNFKRLYWSETISTKSAATKFQRQDEGNRCNRFL